MKWKIALCVALAVILQSSLRNVWEPLKYINLPLITVVYFALRRDPVLAVVVGATAGLATDALSGGLLGAAGFSNTLTAYFIAVVVTRVMLLDNPLFRIPVIAGAAALDTMIYFALHRLLGQASPQPFVETIAYTVIGTTAAGTFIFYALDRFFSDRARTRRQFASRRRVARRSLGRKGY